MRKFLYQNPKALEKTEETTALRKVYIDRYELADLYIEAELSDSWSIFNSMPKESLPLLPEGYLWVRAEDKYSVIRERTIPECNLLLVLYGPNANKKKRINFVFQVDGVTTYSFAHTKNSSGPDKRAYPMSSEDFIVPGYDYSRTRYKGHVRGHLIDHQDTIMEHSKVYWSTYDARNYVPEPPEYEWGLGIRRLKVKKLREKGEGRAYAQFSRYSDTPLKTANGTPVPEYVYFYAYELTATGGYEVREVYNVEWEEDLTRPKGRKVLEYADSTFVTSPEAAPVVVPYVPESPDRAFRHQGRDAFFKASKIASGDIVSRFPEKDKLFAQCAAGDIELEGSSRKILAGLFAAEEEQRRTSFGYTRRAIEYGEDLTELDGKYEIFSEVAAKSGLSFLSKVEDTATGTDVADLSDRLQKLLGDQHSPSKKH